MPDFGNDLAPIVIARCNMGQHALGRVSKWDLITTPWVVANPAGTGQDLLTYLDGLPREVTVTHPDSAYPSSQIAALAETVNVGTLRDRVRGFIHGPFPFMGYAEGR